MEEAGEVVLTNQFGELVVGAVVSGRESSERSRVESGRIANRRHELARTVDQQRAERLGFAQKALQGFSYCGEVVLSERPVGRAGGHRPPVTVSPRGASAFSPRAYGESDEAPKRHTREAAERSSR